MEIKSKKIIEVEEFLWILEALKKELIVYLEEPIEETLDNVFCVVEEAIKRAVR